MRLIRVCALVLIVAVSCSAEGSDAVAVGLRGNNEPFAVVDNCPSVQDGAIEANGQVLWSVRRASPAPETSTVDVPLGVTPEGWDEITPFTAGFQTGVQYLVTVGPDEASLEFRMRDLELGQTYDGQTTEPIGTRSDFVSCDETDGGIDNFGDFLVTAGLLAIIAFGVVGIVAWLVLKGLRRLIDRRAADRLAGEPPDEQWVDRD